MSAGRLDSTKHVLETLVALSVEGSRLVQSHVYHLLSPLLYTLRSSLDNEPRLEIHDKSTSPNV